MRFEETDSMGVVYYAKFFVWFEVGRIELLREIGLPPIALASRKMHTPVVQAHADYKASARYDDEILVRTKIASVGRSSIRFENEVYKLPEVKLICNGHTVHTLVNAEGKPVQIPEDIRSVYLSS